MHVMMLIILTEGSYIKIERKFMVVSKFRYYAVVYYRLM